MNAYLNGEYVDLDEARLSPLDRGFLFGDGAYEVIAVHDRDWFVLDAHLDRLQRSLDALRLDNPHSHAEWTEILSGLLPARIGPESLVYVQVTRGVAPRNHAFPENVTPTVFAMINPSEPMSPAVMHDGVEAITREDFRWRRCDIKSIALLGNVLLHQQAQDEGAVEAILIRDGRLTEATASNVFVVADGVLITPPKSSDLLPGITRDVILDLARVHDVPHREEAVSEATLRSAGEVWISGTTREVMPVTTLDGAPVGNGKVGPVALQMYALFQTAKTQRRERQLLERST